MSSPQDPDPFPSLPQEEDEDASILEFLGFPVHGAIFQTAYLLSPLSSLAWTYNKLIREQYPGFEPMFDRNVLYDFLRPHIEYCPPLFVIPQVHTRALSYLDPTRRKTMAQLWVCQVSAHLCPFVWNIFRNMPAEDGWKKLCLDPPEMFHLELESRTVFCRAFTHEYITLYSPSLSMCDIYEGGAYPISNAEAIVKKMFSTATPYQGEGGRAVVFHFNDPRSTELGVVAGRVTKKKSAIPLRDRLVKGWRSSASSNTLLKEASVEFSDGLQDTNRQIAEAWVWQGLVDPNLFTAEEAAEFGALNGDEKVSFINGHEYAQEIWKNIITQVQAYKRKMKIVDT